MRKGRFLKNNNLLFIISTAVALLLISTPLVMRISAISSIVSTMLEPLRITDYKSSYFEMIGSMLGSFLAVTGALWVQNKKDTEDKINIIKESALIVYYDFEFSFSELSRFLVAYASILPGTQNGEDDVEYFIKYRRGINNIYLDPDWIKTVARLQGSVDDEKIERIYNLYGILNTIKNILDRDDKEIDKKITSKVYILLQREIFDLTTAPKIEVVLKGENKKLLAKLKELKV